jgi:hypothetical protein
MPQQNSDDTNSEATIFIFIQLRIKLNIYSQVQTLHTFDYVVTGTTGTTGCREQNFQDVRTEKAYNGTTNRLTTLR